MRAGSIMAMLETATGRAFPAFLSPKIVSDHAGHVALIITAIGPAGSFDARWRSPIAGRLRTWATELSRRLGFGSGEPAI
jgi:DNA-binding IclR family transcriptional regulator